MKTFLPIWDKNFTEEEIIVFVKKGNEIYGNLLYEPTKIVSVFDRNGKEYFSPLDYEVKGKRIILKNETLPYFEEEWLKYKNIPKNIPCENEDYKIEGCLLLSPKYLREKQFLVRYYHKKERFIRFLPDYIDLPKTLSKLKGEKKLKIALFGDSISNCANSSYEMGFGGFEHYFTSVCKQVSELFNSEVEFVNFSRSGYGTSWAKTVIKEKFKNSAVDLVVIAFGMNDAPEGLNDLQFISNIKEIISGIKKYLPNAEFVLVATPLPNEKSKNVFCGQEKYIYRLKELQCEGVTVIDFTAVSKYLLRSKDYVEISGNNLNHPNDFFYEFYKDCYTELFYKLYLQSQSKLTFEDCFYTPQFEHVEINGLDSRIKAGYIVSDFNGKRIKVFAYYGAPSEDKSYPTLILVHGAGGCAFDKWILACIERGYSAISIDLSGTCFIGNRENKQQNKFAAIPVIGDFGSILSDPQSSWTKYCVSQIMLANSFMRSLKTTDVSRTGLVGISWGGVKALNTLAVDNRFSAGAIIYSAGFISEDLLGQETGLLTEKDCVEFYDRYYDPKNYVFDITKPIMFNAGLTDGAFSPFSRKRTYDLIKSKCYLSIKKDLLHDNESNFNNKNVFSFFDDLFLNAENNLNYSDYKCENNVFSVSVDKKIDSAKLYYAEDIRIDAHKIVWKEKDCDVTCNKITVEIPKNANAYTITSFIGELYYSTDLFIEDGEI